MQILACFGFPWKLFGEKRRLTPLRKVIFILTKKGSFLARKVNAIEASIADYVVGYTDIDLKIL
jgi:hypothetical protein